MTTKPTLYEVLGGTAGVLKAVKRLEGNGLEELDGEIHLLPSSLDLAGLEVELADQADRQGLLEQAIARVGYDYDVVLLDCPPSLGLLTINALAAANQVLIPMQAPLPGAAGLCEAARNDPTRRPTDQP